jgi:hypothetical protein
MSSSTPARSTRSRNLVLLAVAVLVVGGGGAAWLASLDEDRPTSSSAATDAASDETTVASFAGLRDYVDAHTEELVTQTAALETAATEYAELVASHDGDYAAVAADDADAAREVLTSAREAFAAANPAYEEMEGIVAGVPSLADYDVSIDAGAPASEDAEGAVEFDIVVDDERTLEQPGNYFLVTEATLFGTEPEWSSGVAFDVDGNGSTTDVGDLLPDANVLAATTRDFAAEAAKLQKDAAAWTPNEADAFTALVVMTPTMGEYFTSWKQSRFVAGDKATERGFVSSSRLADVVGILGGLEVIRGSLELRMTEADPAAATAIKRDLAALTAFVEDVRAREESGSRFTPAQADRLGSDAQAQAEQVAARVTDIAGELGVDVDA